MKNTKKGLLQLLSISLLFFALLTSSKCEGDTDALSSSRAEPPKQIVTVAHAKEMYEAYGVHRVPIIQAYEDSTANRSNHKIGQEQLRQKKSEVLTAKFDVARYVYYDYETIKQYLAYIEEEAAAADVKISKLRFYFSNYPDKQKFPDGRAILHRKQNSIMISPTLQKGERDFLFYTTDGDQGKRKAVLLNDGFETEQSGIGGNIGETEINEASFLPSPSSIPSSAPPAYFADKSLILNEGSSAPPPYN